MPKQKTSASAGTRKKHAKKAAKHNGEDEDDVADVGEVRPAQRGQKKTKLSKAQKRALPKAKQYVPPPKAPAPPIPNPLDSQGLAAQLPAELVVVLRGLGKKDDVTRRKALEELKDWTTGAVVGDDEVEKEVKETALLSSVPVWLHNLASMLQSPFHRSLAIQLHTEMLSIPSIRSSTLESLSLSLLPGTQNRDILGSWLVAALEEGRRAGGSGLRGWTESTAWLDQDSTSSETGEINLVPKLSELVRYLELSILDPPSLHDDIHPSPVQAAFQSTKPQPPTKGKKKPPGPPATPTPAATSTDDEEVAEERWTRYRVGGLGGLSWLLQQLAQRTKPLPEPLSTLLRNPYLWTAMSVEEEDTLGGKQPVIRRAGYALLETLVNTFPAEAEAVLETLAVAVLDNCWREREATVWETAGSAVAKFLTKYRNAWALALSQQDKPSESKDKSSAPPSSGAEKDGDDEEDEKEHNDSDSEGETANDATDNEAETPISSISFARFLDFIATICPTIPQLTYPILLVAVSTIPDDILSLSAPPSSILQSFYAHLWSPVDARLLATHTLPGQPSAFQIFLQDAIDITCWMVRKSCSSGSVDETARWLATEQLGRRVWAEGVLAMGGKSARRGQKAIETEAERFGLAVSRLDSQLLEDLLKVMGEATWEWCFPSADTPRAIESHLPRLTPIVAAAQASHEAETLTTGLSAIVARISGRALDELRQAATERSPVTTVLAEYLTGILRSAPNLLSSEARKTLVELLCSSLRGLASDNLSSQNLLSLLAAVVDTGDETDKESLRMALWRLVVDHSVDSSARFSLAHQILTVRPANLMSDDLFESIALEAAQAGMDDQSSVASDLAVLCVSPNSPLSLETRQEILLLASTSIHDIVHRRLYDGRSEALAVPASTAPRILATYAEHNAADLMSSDVHVQALVDVRHLTQLFPTISAPEAWLHLEQLRQSKLEPAQQEAITRAILASIGELLADPSCAVSPRTLVDSALRLVDKSGAAAKTLEIMASLLPSTEALNQQLETSTSRPPLAGLHALDSLIPVTTYDQHMDSAPSSFDAHGRSATARQTEALLALIQDDRTLVTEGQVLTHVLSAAQLAQESIWSSEPNCARGMYAPSTNTDYLHTIIQEAKGALSYALASVDSTSTVDLGWHKTAVGLLKDGQNTKGGDCLQNQLATLAATVREKHDDVAARVFRDILSRLLQRFGAGVPEGEVWLNYGMSISEKHTLLSLAVFESVKPTLLDSPPFETAQNRLANALTGISPAQADVKGLSALRLLVASAPPYESTAAFIPERRALFVLRHVGSWIASDDLEDLSDELQLRLFEMFTVLAPIVQSEIGAHWDMIFDVLENTLSEDASLITPTPPLYASLVLLRTVRDLASQNKALRAAWTNQDALMRCVVRLFTQCRNRETEVQATETEPKVVLEEAAPVQMLHDIILDLLSGISESMMAESPLQDLANLLRLQGPPPIQCAAYRLMSRVIKQNTLALVLEVEASVSQAEEGHASRNIELPAALMAIIEQGLVLDWHQDVDIRDVLAQLLAWMAILDHFEDASRTLRWAYLDQLKATDLLDSGLMPMLFAMLGVSQIGSWNFPAGSYAVDEFYPDLLQPDDMADLTPLASHLFYRALTTLPAAMRAYHESIKDRQLSMSMLTFTARHYSSVIIAHEFAALREPAALSALTEEGFTIKIAQGGGATVATGSNAGGSEAIASYVVDDHPMEIGIRLPAEFPLKAVEVRDLKRIGVPPQKWKMWLVSIQQTLTSRNGLMLEALTIFKKNVTLHFEGVDECAICYSIISLTDSSLPTKPCKTCKNRFHASCLFKWFNSSKSSSCPMCRTSFLPQPRDGPRDGAQFPDI